MSRHYRNRRPFPWEWVIAGAAFLIGFAFHEQFFALFGAVQ